MATTDQIIYSQASLQDFSECQRRFYYRYLRQLSWPAAEAEPVLEMEALRQAGEDFHRLAYQYLTGLPAKQIESQSIVSGEIQTWWANFLELGISPDSPDLYPETRLSVQVDGVKLIAKFDLIQIDTQGQATIYDWKTTRGIPSRESLAARWQTIVYPFVLAGAGAALNGGKPIAAEDIRMVYWFANFPDQPVEFSYSGEKMDADREAIGSLLGEIRPREDIEDFPLTPDVSKCRFCVYRSLCDRGESAGLHPDLEYEQQVDFDLDFDQIQEIEF